MPIATGRSMPTRRRRRSRHALRKNGPHAEQDHRQREHPGSPAQQLRGVGRHVAGLRDGRGGTRTSSPASCRSPRPASATAPARPARPAAHAPPGRRPEPAGSRPRAAGGEPARRLNVGRPTTRRARARLVAFTSARSTPGTCASAASTVKAQAAQCMPSTTTCEAQRPRGVAVDRAGRRPPTRPRSSSAADEVGATNPPASGRARPGAANGRAACCRAG